MNASEGTIRTATSRCQHDGQLCPDCLKYYVEDKIKNGNWQSIQCPHASCNEELNGRDVHSIVEEPVYKLFVVLPVPLSTVGLTAQSDTMTKSRKQIWPRIQTSGGATPIAEMDRSCRICPDSPPSVTKREQSQPRLNSSLHSGGATNAPK